MRKLLAGIAVAALLAIAPLADSDAKTLKYAYRIDANSLDPYALAETFTMAFQNLFYEPLVGRGEKLEIIPALATEWTTTQPDTWRFKLRPNVKFHDGSPFTADDVIFSFARAVKQGSDVGYMVAAVKQVVKVDDLTVDMVTHRPNPILPQQITSLYIMSKAWSEKNGAENPSSVKANVQNFATTNANGTGPFMIKERQQDVRTVLAANPHWWEKQPRHNVTEAIFTPIKSDATRVAALLSGEVDMIYPAPLQDVTRISGAAGYRVIMGPEMRTIFLNMDQTRDELLESNVKGKNPFKDLRVRKAFYQAIDIETIKTRIMRGASTPSAIMVGAGVVGHDPALNTRMPYDANAAKALLTEAGYPDGFEVGMDCPNDRYVNDEAICQAVVGMLARIGVKVKLLAQTRTKYFEKILSRNTSFSILGWQPLTYDAHDTFYNIAHTPSDKRGTYNIGGYSNKQVDALIDQIEVEIDPAKRQALLSQMFKIHKDEVGHIPLHQQGLSWGVKNGVNLVQRADDSFDLRFVKID